MAGRRHFFRILFVVCLIFSFTTSAPVDEAPSTTTKPQSAKSSVASLSTTTAAPGPLTTTKAAAVTIGTNSTAGNSTFDIENSNATLENSSLVLENSTSHVDNSTVGVSQDNSTITADNKNITSTNDTDVMADNSTLPNDDKATNTSKPVIAVSTVNATVKNVTINVPAALMMTNNSSASPTTVAATTTTPLPPKPTDAVSTPVKKDVAVSSDTLKSSTTAAALISLSTTAIPKVDDSTNSTADNDTDSMNSTLSAGHNNSINATTENDDSTAEPNVGALIGLMNVTANKDSSPDLKNDTDSTDNSTHSQASNDDTSSSKVTATAKPSDTGSNSMSTASSDIPKVDANPQAPRDVSTAQGKCATLFQNTSSMSSSWIPEKIILNLTDGSAALSSPGLFCGQMPTIMALNVTCASMSPPLSDADADANAVVQGLSTMFTTFCPTNTSTTLTVNAVNGTKCSNSVVLATQNCTSAMKPNGYSYPSEMLVNIMTNSSCKVLGDAKGCILSGLDNTDCSSSQKQAMSTLMDSMIQSQCGMSSAVDTTTTSQPASTAAAAAAKDTPAPSKPSTAASQNSANQKNLSITLLLPIIFLSLAF